MNRGGFNALLKWFVAVHKLNIRLYFSEISVETETDDSAPPLAQAEDQRVSPDQPLTETRPVQDTETAIANSAVSKGKKT